MPLSSHWYQFVLKLNNQCSIKSSFKLIPKLFLRNTNFHDLEGMGHFENLYIYKLMASDILRICTFIILMESDILRIYTFIILMESKILRISTIIILTKSKILWISTFITLIESDSLRIYTFITLMESDILRIPTFIILTERDILRISTLMILMESDILRMKGGKLELLCSFQLSPTQASHIILRKTQLLTTTTNLISLFTRAWVDQVCWLEYLARQAVFFSLL